VTEELQGRILLVDDDELFRRALAERLRADGFEVTDVADGAEAVRLVRGTPGLDTMVLDLSMPGLDGEATLAEVKRFRPELPVVVLTGNGSVESAMDMGSRGVYRYLEKPADPDHLVRVLRRARREKVHAMARQDMPVPSRPSRWGRLIGSNNHRPLIIALGALLILLCAVIPPPQQLVDLVSAKKTAPVAGAPADLHVGYSEYRDMAVGESIADRYSRLCNPVGTDEGGGVHSALDGPATARKAQIMIGLIFTAALFWASGAVPIGITALIVASVMYGFGIMRPDKIAQAFAKDCWPSRA
jgi:sodium-dependent dicarboxylate transporter 2/3/5